MSVSVSPAPASQVIYPDHDGQPMADNTKQFRYIMTIQGGLDAMFANDPNIFVAGDLLWYPVEGENTIRMAPDVLVAFGRPKGNRGSYQQWLEGDIPPQVVFEILSPSNRRMDILRKLGFYEQYGVEECYIYDPHEGELQGWRRGQGQWRQIPAMLGFVSPRLGVRFELVGGELELYGSDGRRFPTYVELSQQREAAQRLAESAEQRAESAEQRAERLAAQLRALGVDPDTNFPR